MRIEDKRKWIIKYAKNNGLSEILNDKYTNNTTFIKRYSSEIQAICSIISVIVIGVVSLVISIKSNKIAEMQLAVSKAELKPVVTFFYEKEVSSGIDRIKIKNSGNVPLNYDVAVISFFDVMANENSMGHIPIRINTLNGICSYNTIHTNSEEMAVIDVYSGTSELINNIEAGVIGITKTYTDLYWDLVHTYVIKVTCIDSLNETSEFYYMYNRWGGNVLSLEKGQEIFQEHNCMISVDGTDQYISKETYFSLNDTTSEAVFRYALKKIREKRLYVNNFPENEIVTYGDYEP